MPEIAAAFDILQATQRRVRRPEIIACPTCGRLEIDLEKIIAELEERLAGRTTAIKISVLGCVVNGPGEAREADLGIAAGNGKGMIFKRGEKLYTLPESEMVDKLMLEIDSGKSKNAPPADCKSGKPTIKADAPKAVRHDDARWSDRVAVVEIKGAGNEVAISGHGPIHRRMRVVGGFPSPLHRRDQPRISPITCRPAIRYVRANAGMWYWKAKPRIDAPSFRM